MTERTAYGEKDVIRSVPRYLTRIDEAVEKAKRATDGAPVTILAHSVSISMFAMCALDGRHVDRREVGLAGYT